MTKAEMVEKLEQARKLIEEAAIGMQEESHTDIEEWYHNLISHIHGEIASIQEHLKTLNVKSRSQ